MTRALPLLAIVTLLLAASQPSYCRPPDQVRYSPVPPLAEPRPGDAPTALVDATRRPPAVTTPSNAPAASPTRTSPEQQQIWKSPEMVAACQLVMEFCARSAQTSPAEGKEFLTQLSQLPPDAMRSWLERFQARRANSLRGQEVEQMARQLKLENAARQQDKIRQAGTNAALLREQAAAEQSEHPPMTLRPGSNRIVPYPGPPTLEFMRNFDPFEAVVDPMSPRSYRRRVAAAMSLPGDLPRGDPRNFIRGEEGIDFGVPLNTGEAVAPTPTAPPTPPAPPANSPAPAE